MKFRCASGAVRPGEKLTKRRKGKVSLKIVDTRGRVRRRIVPASSVEAVEVSS